MSERKWTKELEQSWRDFVADPEANGGLSTLQDCGIEAITMMLAEIDRLNEQVEFLQTYNRQR